MSGPGAVTSRRTAAHVAAAGSTEGLRLISTVAVVGRPKCPVSDETVRGRAAEGGRPQRPCCQGPVPRGDRPRGHAHARAAGSASAVGRLPGWESRADSPRPGGRTPERRADWLPGEQAAASPRGRGTDPVTPSRPLEPSSPAPDTATLAEGPPPARPGDAGRPRQEESRHEDETTNEAGEGLGRQQRTRAACEAGPGRCGVHGVSGTR